MQFNVPSKIEMSIYDLSISGKWAVRFSHVFYMLKKRNESVRVVLVESVVADLLPEGKRLDHKII